MIQGRTAAEWIALLGSRSATASGTAAWALVRLGAGAVPPLVSTLSDPDSRLRRAAATVLGKMGGGAAVDAAPELVRALKDDDEEVVESASWALKRLGPGAVPALVDGLEHRSLRVRKAATTVLGKIAPPSPAATEGLTALLGARDPALREGAIWALTRIGHPALPALKRALEHDDVRVRESALLALGKIRPGAKGAIDGMARALREPRIRPAASWALQRVGGDAVPALARSLRARTPDVRESAAWVLGKISGDAVAAVPQLGAALHDPDPAVRESAAWALVRTGKAARLAFAQALDGDDPDTRRLAVWGLGKVGPELRGSAGLIRKALTDEDEEVRLAAAKALGGLAGDARSAIPALERALDDDDGAVRRAAARALDRIREAA